MTRARKIAVSTSFPLVATLLASACVGTLGDPTDLDQEQPTPGEAPAIYEPAPAALPRLTTLQYQNTLHDLFGPNVPLLPTEADTNPYLYDSIGAATTTLSELGTEQYEQSAEAATQYVFSDPLRRAVFVGCEPATPGDACTQDFIARFGKKAFRRPLSADELGRWTGIAVTLAQPDVWEGLRLAASGMLQSPNFLYRVELGEKNPDNPEEKILTGHEMASRLSFFLWNTTPSEALLSAAEKGELSTSQGIEKHAAQMLEDPRARDAIQRYFAQYLDLRRLEGITRDPQNYPLYTPTLKAAMLHEVQLLVDDIVTRGGDARSLFSSEETFVTSELATLYGVEAPGADLTTFVKVHLPEERAGILTLGAFLTMNAHETDTSPTARGKYVRERVLCQVVQPPPPNVDTSLDPPSGEKPTTIRERLEEHRKNPTCAGCHAFIDPPGFLFEHFDSIGAYRETYPGDIPIDSSGDLDDVKLDDARDLADLLSTDKRVGRCMVTQLYRHAHARLDTKGEVAAINDLEKAFAGADYDFRELLLAMVSHESFRTVSASSTATEQP
ncbi:MAG: DUF1592 domain-containing protein [Polyangiaceae bacterium]|nr:DUF1592 domain-containing protein [Polyangiaceae bacterium]